MAYQAIGTGTNANDGSGDTLRDAGAKVNDNFTELYTKFGDGACDLAPLFGLSKRQVRALAEHLGAPAVLVHKAPTADLECDRPGLTDEEALGLTYDQIDDFLEGKEVSAEVEEKLTAIYLRTQHKRQAIPTVYDAL